MPLFFEFKQTFIRRVVQDFRLGHRGGIVQFIVGDQAEGQFHAVLTDDIQFYLGVHVGPDASIEMTEEMFQALVEHPEQPLRCEDVGRPCIAVAGRAGGAWGGRHRPGPAAHD